jgi:flavin-dependent dehydrogenase
MEATVAVVGAGPAGCAAALTLRRYVPDMSVVLISASGGAGPAAGETLSPGVLPLLGYLGVEAEFLSAGHLPAGGTASAWGSPQVSARSYLFSGRGLGWHLDRARFDAWLRAQAQAAGAQIIDGRALVRSATRSQSRWLLEVKGGGMVAARAVVDASGRSAQLARRQGSRPRRDDALVAEVRWYVVGDRCQRVAEGALVESVPDGWWYSATLPGGRAVAMFMTDADLRKQSTWDERLAQAAATAGRVERWHATGETAVRAANSQISPAVTADGWVAAGDAAAAFDPISALGVGFSLRSGMEAARVAAAAAEQDTRAAGAYAASVARIYADYRARFLGIYEQERRWPQSPFWTRRTGARR